MNASIRIPIEIERRTMVRAGSVHDAQCGDIGTTGKTAVEAKALLAKSIAAIAQNLEPGVAIASDGSVFVAHVVGVDVRGVPQVMLTRYARKMAVAAPWDPNAKPEPVTRPGATHHCDLPQGYTLSAFADERCREYNAVIAV